MLIYMQFINYTKYKDAKDLFSLLDFRNQKETWILTTPSAILSTSMVLTLAFLSGVVQRNGSPIYLCSLLFFQGFFCISFCLKFNISNPFRMFNTILTSTHDILIAPLESRQPKLSLDTAKHLKQFSSWEPLV